MSYCFNKDFKIQTRSSNETYFYVFNFENGEGYAIMSADASMPDLLMYAPSGYFVLDSLLIDPSKFKEIQPIAYHTADSDDNTYSVIVDTEDTFIQAEGLCKVKWGQGTPYNKYCQDGTVQTGCAATALAQIMSVYKYPSSYKGTTFDWDAMIADYTNDAIAKLMYYLGLPSNLNMSYGATESGSSTSRLTKTLESFGYKSATYSDYKTSVVISEITDGYPIVSIGTDEENSASHGWVIHGALKRTYTIEHRDIYTDICKYKTYKSEYYVLCNWGWSGLCDGYYLSNVFDLTNGAIFKDPLCPNNYTSKYDFSSTTQMVYNIRK
jgi:hypothetical protein